MARKGKARSSKGTPMKGSPQGPRSPHLSQSERDPQTNPKAQGSSGREASGSSGTRTPRPNQQQQGHQTTSPIRGTGPGTQLPREEPPATPGTLPKATPAPPSTLPTAIKTKGSTTDASLPPAPTSTSAASPAQSCVPSTIEKGPEATALPPSPVWTATKEKGTTAEPSEDTQGDSFPSFAPVDGQGSNSNPGNSATSDDGKTSGTPSLISRRRNSDLVPVLGINRAPLESAHRTTVHSTSGPAAPQGTFTDALDPTGLEERLRQLQSTQSNEAGGDSPDVGSETVGDSQPLEEHIEENDPALNAPPAPSRLGALWRNITGARGITEVQTEGGTNGGPPTTFSDDIYDATPRPIIPKAAASDSQPPDGKSPDDDKPDKIPKQSLEELPSTSDEPTTSSPHPPPGQQGAAEAGEQQDAEEDEEQKSIEDAEPQLKSFFCPFRPDPRYRPPGTTSPREGESPMSYRVRDTIERTELEAGRTLLPNERAVIEATIRELQTPSVLSPAITSPPISPKPEDELWRLETEEPKQTLTRLHKSNVYLVKQVQAFVGELDQHSALLRTLGGRLDRLEQRRGRPGQNQTQQRKDGEDQPQSRSGNKQFGLWKARKDKKDAEAKDRETGWFERVVYPQPLGPRQDQIKELLKHPQVRLGGAILAIFLGCAALVWIVTETMLHSKRLSSGYGPFLNAGYNGLQSVMVFRSWTQFLVLNCVVLFLGGFAVLGVMKMR